MKKAVNKSLLACITSFLLLFGCVFIDGDTVCAGDTENYTILASTEARYLNDDVKALILKSTDLKDRDIVSLVQTNTSARNSSVSELQISRVTPDHTELTSVAAYDIDNTGTLTQVNVPFSVTSALNSLTGIVTDYQSKYKITMSTTVYYSVNGSLSDLFIRPYQTKFSYSYVSGATTTIDFQKLIFSFRAVGDFYYGSTFQSDDYTFRISATWTNLVAGRSYYAAGEMPNGYYLKVNNSSYHGCFSADYKTTINGSEDYINRPIP